MACGTVREPPALDPEGAFNGASPAVQMAGVCLKKLGRVDENRKYFRACGQDAKIPSERLVPDGIW